MNIAIDGPAGAGKSTIAKRVAKELGSIYVDTGAMYRALALFLLRQELDPADTAALERSCDEVEITLTYEGGRQHVFLNGEDVTDFLRTEEVSQMASVTSANAKVRRTLVRLQQKLAAEVPVVMDGRDIGTVVLPDAELKVYLTASAAARAKRRYAELKDRLPQTSYEDILRDMEERDFRDMHRENSPLRQAEDAVLVDSSDMTIGEVTETILALARERAAGE